MYFFFKLLPPRPDFHLTMDEKENAVMKNHVAYWTALFEKRKVIVFGPVFDPSGVYGMAVIETDTEEQANLIKDNDPAIASGICTGNLFQMRVGLTK